MKIPFKKMNLRPKTLDLIDTVDEIMQDYANQNIVPNLRMIYYQLVSLNIIANKDTEYDRLGILINNGRLCGLLDWELLEDQTRNIRTSPYWLNPSEIIQAVASSYRIDLWENQDVRPEVWIEKDALVPVVGPVCTERQVPFMSCRGYMSQSEMYVSYKRIRDNLYDDKKVVLLHLGDHDPSGLDMTRDIEERLLEMLAYTYMQDHWNCDVYDKGNIESALSELSSVFRVERIALTRAQIEEYQPLPQPVKKSDSKWKKYVNETGLYQSWELDALKPNVLQELVRNEINDLLHPESWNARVEFQNTERALLKKVSNHWENVVKYVEKLKDKA